MLASVCSIQSAFAGWADILADRLRNQEAEVTKVARFLAIGLVFALVPSLAFAHEGHSGGGLTSGIFHPFTGLDHMLAMLAVGVWAAQLGARLTVPLAFVAMLLTGAIAGASGLHIPAVEPMIGLSVIALGLASAFSLRLPQSAAMALVGLFAFFHGAAHGYEMPAMANAWVYGSGFVAATLVLHAAGVGLGGLSQRLIRPAGALTAAAGTALLLMA